MNYFKNIVGGNAPGANVDDLKNELKKREGFIDKLKDKVKKLTEEKDFVNKSYEELEKKHQRFSSQVENQNAFFKKNVDYFVNQLQNVPQDIIDSITTAILQKLNENVGELLGENEVKSFLDIDFNYKNIFNEYIGKIYELVKQNINKQSKANDALCSLQLKLVNKDKQIEELIDRYENNIKNIEKQLQVKMSNKVEEFNMIREQKDFLLQNLTETNSRNSQQIQDLKSSIAKIRSNQNSLKLAKQKIENKTTEAYQMNKHLINKNTELEMELNTLKAEKQVIMGQIISENQTLKQELLKLSSNTAQLRRSCSQMQKSCQDYVQRINLHKIRQMQWKNRLSKISMSSMRKDLQFLKQEIQGYIKKTNQTLSNNQELQQICLRTNQLAGQFKSIQTNFIQSQSEAQKQQIEKIIQQKQAEITTLKQQIASKIIQNEKLIDKTRQIQGLLFEKHQQIDTISQQLVNFKQQLTKCQARILKLEQTNSQNESTIRGLQDKKIEDQEIINDLRQKNSTAQSQRHELMIKMAEFDAKIKQDQQHIQKIEAEAVISKENISNLNKDRIRFEDDYQYLQSQFARTAHDLKQAKQHLIAALDRNSVLENSFNEVSQVKASQDKDIQEMKIEHQTLNEKLVKANEMNDQLKIQLSELQTLNNGLKQRQKQLLKNNQEKDSILQQKYQQVSRLQSDITSANQQKCRLIQEQSSQKSLLFECQKKLRQKEEQIIQKQASYAQNLQQIANKQAKTNSQLEILKVSYSRLEGQNQTMQKQLTMKIRKLENQIQDKERSCAQKQYELERLTETIKIMNESINQKEGVQNNSLTLIHQLEVKYKGEIEDKHNLIQNLQNVVRKLEIKNEQNHILLASKQKQNDLKIQQVENLKIQIAKLQEDQKHLGDLLAKKEQQMSNISKNKNEEIQLLQAEINQITLSAQQIQHQLKQSLQKSSTLEQDLRQDLSKTSNQYTSQINQLEQTVSILKQKIKTAQVDLVNHQQQNNRQSEVIIKLNLEKQLLSKDNQRINKQIQILVSNYQEQELKNITQINSLTQTIRIQKEQRDTEQQKYSQLLREKNRLEENISELTSNIQVLKKQTQQSSLQIEIYEQNSVILNQQKTEIIDEYSRFKEEMTEEYNLMKKQQQQQIQITKNNYQAQLNKLQNINSEELNKINDIRQQLNTHNGQLLEQLNSYKQNCLQKQQLISKLEHQIIDMRENKQKLTLRVQNQERQILDQKNKFNLLTEEQGRQIERFYQFQLLKQNIQKQLAHKKAQNQDLKAQIQSFISKLTEQESKSKQHEQTIINLQQKTTQLAQEIQNISNTNNHLQTKISTLHQQKIEISQQLQLDQQTNIKMMQDIQILRQKYDQTHIQNNLIQQRLLQDIKSIEQMEKIIQVKNQDIKQLKEKIFNVEQSYRTKIVQLQLDLEANIQQNSINKQQIIQKVNQLREKIITISELEHKLAEQIQTKNQALEDKEFMSQIYKDFEARQTQMTQKQQAYHIIQECKNHFQTTFKKQFVKESINYIKNTFDTLSLELKESNNQLSKSQANNQQQKIQMQKKIEQLTKLQEYNERKILEISKQKQSLFEQNEQNRQKVLKLAQEHRNKQVEILNSLNKYEETNEKLKQQIQQYKAKYNKKQSQISKFSELVNSLQQKIVNLKNSVSEKQKQLESKNLSFNQQKKQLDVFKSKLLEENKAKIEEKQHYQQQLHKMRGQIERLNVENTQQLKKQLINKEESFKIEKMQLELKYKEQVKKSKEVIQSAKKEKEEAQKQVLNFKNLLLQQKKISAKTTAKLNDVVNDLNKLENLQSSNQQIQQKMMLKDEQIKKCFANINSLKNTMSDLEEGIQTYQSMAQERERQAEQHREKCVKLQEDIAKLESQIQRLERKAKDTRIQQKYQRVVRDNPIPIIDKKEASILPLKLLFLKYFEAGSSYETKLRAFNTLCQALSLNSKELQLMNQYKRTKLALQASNNAQKQKNQSLQNKFFNFLTSD